MYSCAARSKTKICTDGDIFQPVPCRGAPPRVERAPTVQAGPSTPHRGFQSRARPHGARQQPPITCVPTVFDYILIRRCKSKNYAARNVGTRRRFTQSGAIQQRKARGIKNVLRERKRNFPFNTAQCRASKRGGSSTKRRRGRKIAERYAKLTKFPQRHASGGKSRRAPQTATATKILQSFSNRRRGRTATRTSKKRPIRGALFQSVCFAAKLRRYFPIIISAKTFASFSMCLISMCSFGMWAQSISWHQTTAGIPARRKKAPHVPPPTPPTLGFMPG